MKKGQARRCFRMMDRKVSMAKVTYEKFKEFMKSLGLEAEEDILASMFELISAQIDGFGVSATQENNYHIGALKLETIDTKEMGEEEGGEERSETNGNDKDDTNDNSKKDLKAKEQDTMVGFTETDFVHYVLTTFHRSVLDEEEEEEAHD